jgi:hypothetical protein
MNGDERRPTLGEAMKMWKDLLNEVRERIERDSSASVQESVPDGVDSGPQYG